jgi:hypothetical protein
MNKYFLYIFIVVFTVSCKATRKIAKNDYSETIESYIDKKFETAPSQNFLAEQVDVTIDNGEKQSAKAKVYVSPGHLIFLTVNFLGFEIARAQLTPDSLKFINRVSKEYFFGDIGYFQKMSGLNISYEELESMLIKGIPYRKSDTKEDIARRITDNGTDYVYTYGQGDRRSIKVYFTKSPVRQYKIEVNDDSSQSNFVAMLGAYNNDPYYPDELQGSFLRRRSKTDVSVKIGKIENKEITNNSFRVNSNYDPLDK